MSVRTGQSVTTTFTTSRFDTGAATNADSPPTGVLYVNGAANGATVTVANVTTGLYSAAVTLPTLAVGDGVTIVISATVNSVAGKGKVWEDSKDVAVDSSGKVPATLAAADVTGNVPADVQTIKTQAVTCAGGVTVPAATLASTTNITAGTITTATNLTNAPTAGDLTAAMKTSIGTAVAASAVASVTGNVGGNLVGNVGGNVDGSVSGSVGSVLGDVDGSIGDVRGDVLGKLVGGGATAITGPGAWALDGAGAAIPTAAAILAAGDVDGFTLEQTLKLCLAALAGKLSGAATTTVTIRAADDSKARITATVDADGNRSTVTLDAAG